MTQPPYPGQGVPPQQPAYQAQPQGYWVPYPQPAAPAAAWVPAPAPRPVKPPVPPLRVAAGIAMVACGLWGLLHTIDYFDGSWQGEADLLMMFLPILALGALVAGIIVLSMLSSRSESATYVAIIFTSLCGLIYLGLVLMDFGGIALPGLVYSAAGLFLIIRAYAGERGQGHHGPVRTGTPR